MSHFILLSPMNIVVDYGNTIAKVGIFKDQLLQDKILFHDTTALRAFIGCQPAENIIVSSVSFPSDDVLSWSIASGKRISLSTGNSLPIQIKYKTPKTLGVDRIAAVCG